MADRPGLDPVDLFVYAPIGVASRLQTDLPEWIAVGRERMNTELVTAKGIGMLAVGQLRRRLQGATRPPTPRPKEQPRPERQMRAERRPDPDTSAQASAQDRASRSVEPRVLAADELPIDGYDSLSAVQVLPRLAALSPAELDLVSAHEQATRGRRTILHRIDQLTSRAT